MYADLSMESRDIFSIILHGVGVETSFSLRRDHIRLRQSKTTAATLWEKVVVRQFARCNNAILGTNNPESDTTYTGKGSEMKKDADQRK